jgi:hypothetical protein
MRQLVANVTGGTNAVQHLQQPGRDGTMRILPHCWNSNGVRMLGMHTASQPQQTCVCFLPAGMLLLLRLVMVLPMLAMRCFRARHIQHRTMRIHNIRPCTLSQNNCRTQPEIQDSPTCSMALVQTSHTYMQHAPQLQVVLCCHPRCSGWPPRCLQAASAPWSSPVRHT